MTLSKSNPIDVAENLAEFAKETIAVQRYVMDMTGKNRLEMGQTVFLWGIASHGEAGVSMVDLAKELGVDGSFISRNVKVFGHQSMTPHWVDQHIDYDNPRSRKLKLTPHAKKVLANSLGIASGELEYDLHTKKVKAPKKG